jgi:hypothetical protein
MRSFSQWPAAEHDVRTMGPLFSAIVVVIGAVVCIAAAFAVLRLFRNPSQQALVLAIAGAAGALLGAVGAAVVAIPVVGVGQTLSSNTSVVLYLSSLGLASVTGGILALRLASGVLTVASSRRANARGLS